MKVKIQRRLKIGDFVKTEIGDGIIIGKEKGYTAKRVPLLRWLIQLKTLKDAPFNKVGDIGGYFTHEIKK